MFHKIYTSDPSEFFWFFGSMLFFAEVFVVLLIVACLIYRSKMHGTLKMFLGVVIAGLVFCSIIILTHFEKDHPNGGVKITGHIVVVRESSLVAGSVPGEFRIGEKQFKFGLNSPNYAITDIVKDALPNEVYLVKYGSDGVVAEIWKKIENK